MMLGSKPQKSHKHNYIWAVGLSENAIYCMQFQTKGLLTLISFNNDCKQNGILIHFLYSLSLEVFDGSQQFGLS